MMDTVTITQRHLPPELRGLPCLHPCGGGSCHRAGKSHAFVGGLDI